MDLNINSIGHYNAIKSVNSNVFLNEKIGNEDMIETSFSDVLKEKFSEVNDKQIEADVLTQKMIKGDDVSIHEVMLAGEEAKISLQLAVQVRNKLVEAFQEISRTQI